MGTGGTTGVFPPSSNTAISSARFTFKSNLMQNPTQSAVPMGNTVAKDNYNTFNPSGMLNTSGSGIGLLTSAYKSAHPGVLGTIGAEIG
jgi:hypothetical protein